MTSSEGNGAMWRDPSHNPAHHQRLVSPGGATYVLASLFFMGLGLVPAAHRIPMINRASAFLARLLHTANVHSTRVIRGNLEAVIGLDRAPVGVETDVRKLLAMTVWNSLIINSLPALPARQTADLAHIEGISYLDKYLASGHPVLIWSFHFGVHPLIVAAILHARGYPIHAITHVRQLPTTANVYQRLYLRRQQGVSNRISVIDPREGAQRKMLDVLKRKECLYVTPDYMIPEDERQPKSAFEVPVDFLRRRAIVQSGGLRLAKRLKARVVTVFSRREDGNERRLIVEPFKLPTPGLTPAELQQDLQMCMRRLEDQILAYPHWWLDLKRDDLSNRLSTISHDESVNKEN